MIFTCEILGLTALLFVMAWAGMNRDRRPYFWGGPMLLSDVVAELPRLAGEAFVVVCIVHLVFGIRRDVADVEN